MLLSNDFKGDSWSQFKSWSESQFESILNLFDLNPFFNITK